MKFTSKRRKGFEENNGIDRLSELPDHVLFHILSFLPTLDVVRTLSIRRFGNLWTLIPSLIFYDIDFIKIRFNNEEFVHSFANFVRNVLLHRKVSIDNFKLCFFHIDLSNDKNKLFANEVTTWIRFAIDKEVKDLEIYRICTSIIPQCVFTSQFLVTLELVGCQVTHVIEASKVQMRSLRKLSLSEVEISNELFKKFMQGCPSLQELVLRSVTKLNELCAPNVEYLCLHRYYGLLDCPNLKYLDFNSTSVEPMQMLNVSSIREVNITCCSYPQYFEEYVEKFSNAEVFNYNDAALLKVSNFKDRDFLQTKWKRLHVETKLCGDHLLVLCRILRSSPQLEELIVSCSYRHSLPSANDILCRELPSCLMQQLKTVTLSSCYEVPCPGLLQLAEFLLKSCVTLEKMVILPDMFKSAASNELKFVKQLLSFPRSSTNARVIFGSEIY